MIESQIRQGESKNICNVFTFSRTNGHKISTVSCGSNSSCGSSVSSSTTSTSGSHVKKPKLKIDNLRAETLEEVLSYIYTDSSASVDSGNSESLLKAADAYALPGLKAHCEHYLSGKCC